MFKNIIIYKIMYNEKYLLIIYCGKYCETYLSGTQISFAESL